MLTAQRLVARCRHCDWQATEQFGDLLPQARLHDRISHTVQIHDGPTTLYPRSLWAVDSVADELKSRIVRALDVHYAATAPNVDLPFCAVDADDWPCRTARALLGTS